MDKVCRSICSFKNFGAHDGCQGSFDVQKMDLEGLVVLCSSQAAALALGEAAKELSTLHFQRQIRILPKCCITCVDTLNPHCVIALSRLAGRQMSQPM
eukprot:3376115-Amphidinium_carterae.2